MTFICIYIAWHILFRVIRFLKNPRPFCDTLVHLWSRVERGFMGGSCWSIRVWTTVEDVSARIQIDSLAEFALWFHDRLSTLHLQLLGLSTLQYVSVVILTRHPMGLGNKIGRSLIDEKPRCELYLSNFSSENSEISPGAGSSWWLQVASDIQIIVVSEYPCNFGQLTNEKRYPGNCIDSRDALAEAWRLRFRRDPRCWHSMLPPLEACWARLNYKYMPLLHGMNIERNRNSMLPLHK